MEFLGMSAEMIAAIFGVLFAISELLSLIPAIKANGVFQAIYSGLKWIGGKFLPKKPE